MSFPNTEPILVLGAYGEAGEAVVRGLVDEGLPVLASGRRPRSLARLAASCPGIETLELDAQDAEALTRATRAAGLVINCVGPYIGTGAEIARIAVSQGCSVIDLASEQEHHRRLQSLAPACREQGVTVLTGAGAYPGVSGLLLRGLMAAHPGATSVELALITGPPAEHGRGGAQMLSGLAELAHWHAELAGGELVTVRPGARRRFQFPEPFGERAVLAWPQLEILEAATEGILDDLCTYAALGGHSLPPAFLLRAASWLRPTTGSWSHTLLGSVLPGFQRPPPAGDPTTNHGAILVRVEDQGTWFETSVLATDLPTATAWLPVHAAARWASGDWQGGVVAVPMSFFDAVAVTEPVCGLDHLSVQHWDQPIGAGTAHPDPLSPPPGATP